VGTRIAVVADVHLWNHRAHGWVLEGGINRRCRQSIATLRAAVERAEALGAEAFIVAGDLFDGLRPEPQVIAAAQEALQTKMGVILLAGNHDLVSSVEGDHTLGPLSQTTSVVTSSSLIKIGDTILLCVPFQQGPASKWLPEAVQSLSKECENRYPVMTSSLTKILVTHVGLAHRETPSFLKTAHDVIDSDEFGKLLIDHGIKVGMAGNWHAYHRFTYSANPYQTAARGDISGIQVGALVPTGWDNAGCEEYGTLLIVDTHLDGPVLARSDADFDSVVDWKVVREVITGPRFLNTLDSAVLAHQQGNQAYVRLVTGESGLATTQALLASAISRGDVVAGEVVLDGVDSVIAARSAAEVTRNAKTLDEALEEYVRTMPISDGVDRASVLARARRYLGVF